MGGGGVGGGGEGGRKGERKKEGWSRRYEIRGERGLYSYIQ